MSVSTNLNRLRTKKAITLFPGVHLRMLQRLTDTSFNTTRHHVRSLELSGEIVKERASGHERLYPAGLAENERSVKALVLDRTTRRIMESLLKFGPMGNGEISRATDVPKSTVSEHVDLLRRAALIQRRVDVNGVVSYDLKDRERVAQLLASFQANLLTSAADRFVDLWDL